MKKLFTLIAVAAMAFVAQANVLTVCYNVGYHFPIVCISQDIIGCGFTGLLAFLRNKVDQIMNV